MIGVIANPSEHAVVREFFELFKTPWEFYRSDRQYDVLLCAGDCALPEHHAKLAIIYAGQGLPSDAEDGIQIASQRKDPCILSYRGSRIPIYGSSIAFGENAAGDLRDESSHQPATYVHQSNGRVLARIGYDLFREVRTLLTVGQPAVNASLPAMELHIAVLRDLISASGAPLVEIPPVPDGYRFIACLTHDVDHPRIRPHKLDHTMFGFLYRAILGSLFKVLRRRAPWRHLLANCVAALKLPLVYLGLAKDFWSGYDRYTLLEGGARSTFFVIPFKGRPGRSGRGSAPSRRASRSGAADISDHIRTLTTAGCEVGLHGIDAWLDSSSGSEELGQIRQITGMRDVGVRMHWLYFDEQSPVILEQAGADYDSTVGYNGTVGYRAGTTQVYRPLGAARLLELPLHVMDTALFYPSHLGLSPAEASDRVGKIIDNAVRFGGSVTINWHDRSIAPERLWDDFYVQLVDELKQQGAWFATAAETVQWFRKRRSVTFDDATWESDALHGKTAVDVGGGLLGLRLRVHNAPEPCPTVAIGAAASARTRDPSLNPSDACVALSGAEGKGPVPANESAEVRQRLFS